MQFIRKIPGYQTLRGLHKLYQLPTLTADVRCKGKIHNKQVNVDHSHLTTTPNNKFLIPHSKTKHHMNSFFPRAIRLWNELPTEIKDAPTVPAFASGLNKFYAF